MPSLMISKTSKGDTLWKLAKKHHSTATLILAANGLENEEEIREGQMLIVPKKR
jgi:LysM repeat protein